MVAENVLAVVENENLRIYAVWQPVLAADDRDAARAAPSILDDSRVSHFWDIDQALGRAFGKSLELPRGGELAWDMYLVFPPDSAWNDDLPTPSHWSHQLGVDERYLGDGTALREAVEAAAR